MHDRLCGFINRLKTSRELELTGMRPILYRFWNDKPFIFCVMRTKRKTNMIVRVLRTKKIAL